MLTAKAAYDAVDYALDHAKRITQNLWPQLGKILEEWVGRVIGTAQQRAADATVRRDVAGFDAGLLAVAL